MTDDIAYRRIGIMGAGRVGQAMALALAAHSTAPLLLWTRGGGSARAMDMGDLAGCDLILLAVADDAMAPVAAALAGHVAPGSFVFHVSGRSGAAILAPLAARGAAIAAIHPAMTFTGDPAAEVARMAGARFAVTAPDAEALAAARRVVALLGGVPVEIAEAQRPLYHAALCHGANHLVTLIAGAADALRAAGVAEPEALLAPLVRAALENSIAAGFGALSGPLLRGDGETIGGHMAAIARDCPTLLPAYRAMALATVDELERDGAAKAGALRLIIMGDDV